MNKKEWKSEYSKWRAIKGAACFTTNELRNPDAARVIFNVIFANAPALVRSAIFDRHDSPRWHCPTEWTWATTSNMKLPANHRGHLA